MNKGFSSILITLGVVIIGIITSLTTLSLLKKQSSIISNPKAATCGPPVNLSTLTTACCFSQINSTCNKYERVYAHLSARIANQMTTPCTTACYGTAYNATAWYDCPDSTVDHCADPTKTPVPTRGCSANGSPCGLGICCSNYCNTSTLTCANSPNSTPTRTSTPRPPGAATNSPTPRLTSPPGSSTIPTKTPTPPPNLPPTIPPAQACRLGVDTYTIGQSYCDETNNIAKKCLGNGNWQTTLNPCGTSKCTNDPGGPSYSCKAKCEALEINGSNKLKIAFLPMRFTNLTEFRDLAKKGKDVMKNTNLGILAYKMNFYIVNDISQTYIYDKTNNDGARICGADFSVLIDNPAICGYGGGGSYGGPTLKVCGVVDSVIAHELGHSVTQLADEYGGTNGSPDTISPNHYAAEPALNCTKNPACPKWINMPGTSCIQGCGSGENPPNSGFSNWYRPSQISLMRDAYISNQFNPPSLKAWQDYLKNYQ